MKFWVVEFCKLHPTVMTIKESSKGRKELISLYISRFSSTGSSLVSLTITLLYDKFNMTLTKFIRFLRTVTGSTINDYIIVMR